MLYSRLTEIIVNLDQTDRAESSVVLFVTGNADGQGSVENILDKHGFRVKKLASAAALADLLSVNSPQLIIFGAGHLRGDGFDRLRKSILKHRDDNVAFLVECEHDDDAGILTGLPGLVDFIRKPYSPADLLARVSILLRVGQLKSRLEMVRAQLIHAQKMECVGALVPGVVHEINNLMFSVMGYAELAKLKGGADIEALRESVEVSYATSRRATATAASLLAFSGPVNAQKTMDNINNAVTAVVRLVKRNILEKNNITLKLNLGELPETMFAMGPMQQVLLNLIINAWHAMENSREERCLTITTVCEDMVRIVIAVKDTGKGISKDMQRKVFEPLQAMEGPRSSDGIGGSGLGLTIVMEIVQDHGGTVELKSDIDKGAEFRITIPVQLERADEVEYSSIEKEDLPGTGSKGFSVLIIDDEEPNRKVMSGLLLRRGHEAYAASNMAEAMTLIGNHKIDLITMDMVMPKEDGVTNIERLRAEGIEIPILICSGQAGSDVVARGMKAGANGFVEKPFSAQEFIEAIQKCLEGSLALHNPL